MQFECKTTVGTLPGSLPDQEEPWNCWPPPFEGGPRYFDSGGPNDESALDAYESPHLQSGSDILRSPEEVTGSISSSVFSVACKEDDVDAVIGEFHDGTTAMWHKVLDNLERSSSGSSSGTSLGKQERQRSRPHISGGRIFTLEEIQKATDNYEEGNFIAKGGFGHVYKGKLEDGTPVAVKRGSGQTGQGLPEFHSEINLLCQIRHRHLVGLVGWCHEQDELILVYEYMEQGTLRSHLYGSSKPPVDWVTRLEACIGAARGLHYLHTGAMHPIIHRDVKTTNILLDDKWEAKLSDLGLSKLGPAGDRSHVSTEVKGTPGYLDPQYYKRQQLTEKSDVYSFGVVLLEAICGRAVIDNSLPSERVYLVDWVLLCEKRGETLQILDPVLKFQWRKESIFQVISVAIQCVSDHGADRPNMGEVLWQLENALSLQEAASTVPTGPMLRPLLQREASSGMLDGGSSARKNRPCNLPFSRNPLFRGRMHELGEIYKFFHSESEEIGVRSMTLTGLGGLGKTQTALEYAYRHIKEYDGVLWVDAGQNALDNFAGLAKALEISMADHVSLAEQVEEVRRALEAGHNDLLILDNVEAGDAIESMRPKIGRCHIIITTRLRLDSAVPFDLELMSMDDALEVLRFVSIGYSKEYSVNSIGLLEELARELGMLPIALSAASRLLASGYDPAKLLSRIRKNAPDLLERAPTDLLFQKPSSLKSLFEASIESLQQEATKGDIASRDAMLAVAMFEVGAWFGPQPIPLPLLTLAATLRCGWEVDEEEDGELALPKLDRLSLIQRELHGGGIVFHRLLQAYARTRDGSRQSEAIVLATVAGARCFKPTVGHFNALWERRDELLRHGCSTSQILTIALGLADHHHHCVRGSDVIETCDVALAWAPPRSNLRWLFHNQKAYSLAELFGRYSDALKELKVCFKELPEELAGGPPELLFLGQTAYCMFYLEEESRDSELQAIREKAEGMVDKLVPLVKDRKSGGVYGHYAAVDITGRCIAEALACLACCYRFSNPQKCIALTLKSLSLKERILVPDHPDILEAHTNIAFTLRDSIEAARVQHVVEMAVAALEEEQKKKGLYASLVLPGVARSRARAQENEAGRLEAKEAFRRALASYEKSQQSLGDELAYNSWTAYLLCELGRLTLGEDGAGVHYLQRLIRITEKDLGTLRKRYGPESSEVSGALKHVGVALRYMGTEKGLAEARKWLARSLAIAERANDTVSVLRALYNLGQVAMEQGRHKEAFDILLRAHDIAESIFRTGSPHRDGILYHIVTVHLYLGNPAAASQLLSTLMAQAEERYGSSSLKVADALSILGCTHLLQGEYKEALACHERALAIRTQLYPHPHPLVAITTLDVAAAQSLLAHAHDASSTLRDAASILRSGAWPETQPLLNQLAHLSINRQTPNLLSDTDKESFKP